MTPGLAQWAVYGVALLVLTVFLAYRFRARYLAALRRNASRACWWLVIAAAVTWTGTALIGLATLVLGEFSNSTLGWLVFYLSPLGLVLSLSGIVYLLWQMLRSDTSMSTTGDQVTGDERTKASPELLSLLLVTGLLLLLYSMNPLVARWQPWAVRRLVPMILPVLALAAGALVAAPILLLSRQTWHARAWLLTVSAALVLFAQLGLEIRASRPIIFHDELRAYAAQLQSVAAALPDGAVLLLDDGLIAQGLPQAFDLWLGHPALALQEAPTGRASVTLNEVIAKARARWPPSVLCRN